jgi:hypothetical protein
MMTAIRVIGLVLAAAVIGCDRGKPREEAATHDAKASADADLRKALDAATKKAKEMEARAKAAEARLAKAQQAQAGKTPPASTSLDSELPEQDEVQAKIDALPNAQRPVGDRVIRGWDGYKFRDVRIKDLVWLLTSDNQIVIQGVPKTPKGMAPPYLINGPDLNQVAEAWVIEFVTGKKVDIPQR